MWVIYKHTLLIGKHAGWSYIGQTSRDVWHKRFGTGGSGYRLDSDRVFARAIKKYGWENFSHEIVEDNIATQELANEREIYWISFYHTFVKDPNRAGYNMTPGGNAFGTFGSKWITNGQEEMLLRVDLDVPSGWELGRSDTSVNKIRESNKRQVVCIETNEIFNSLRSAQEKYHHVWDVLAGYRKTSGGFHFKYLDDSYVPKIVKREKKSYSERDLAEKFGAKKVRCVETDVVYNSISEAVKLTGICKIGEVIRGHRHTAGGYHWELLEL